MLHLENIPLRGYIDDFFTKADTFSNCEENIEQTMLLYNKCEEISDSSNSKNENFSVSN